MTARNRIAALTLTTALVSASAAYAIELDLSDDQMAQLEGECQTLADTAQGMDELPQGVERDRLTTALEGNDTAACGDIIATLESDMQQDGEEATDTASASESETVTEEVTATAEVSLTEEALARVRVPEPEVDVAVPAPNVRVSQGAASVTVDEGQGTIEVSQAQPQISVEIPQIVVRVEIPAPRLFVRRGESSVQISSADPQIEVEQGDPTVSVRQGQPEIDLTLDIEGAETEGSDSSDGGDTQTASAEQSGDGSGSGVGAAVNVSRDGDATVEIVQTDAEPEVQFNQAQSEVSYESQDPQISVNVTAEPTVEIAQVGEIEVIYETEEERQARRDGEQTEGDGSETQQADASQGQTDGNMSEGEGQQADASSSEGQQTEGQIPEQVTVADLMGMDVVGSGGESFGSPEAFVRQNGELMMIISEGGFLGMGDTEIGVPLSDVVYTPEALQLQEMDEEALEQAAAIEWSSEDEVADDTTIRLRQ